MARRRFTVRDIAEILEHWQAGRSISAIARSLGVARFVSMFTPPRRGVITRVTPRHLKAGRRS
ncbi:hypothetical protein M1N13_01935 [Dehalococcoidia bacterium]|nr:hypothetical protein [Dehalococcoidia bacterium]MCL0058047.1 hypothetical protein [Dehalococcoidales bacterium]